MRALVLTTLLAFVPACGGDGSKNDTDAGVDLAAMTSDLSAPQSCGQIYACTTGAATPLQFGTCAAAGTSDAQALYMALYQCALGQCMLDDGGVPNDAGAGSCTSVSDATATCNACVHAAEASAACSSQLAACQNE